MASEIRWSRSRKGNLWAVVGGMTATVFPRKGGFAWCIHDGKTPRFADLSYASEQEALVALQEELAKAETTEAAR